MYGAVLRMRVSDKLEVIDRIGRELQSRYTFGEIDAYLAEFGVPRLGGVSRTSMWIYLKTALSGAPLDTITRIVEDLDMGSLARAVASHSPPRN